MTRILPDDANCARMLRVLAPLRPTLRECRSVHYDKSEPNNDDFGKQFHGIFLQVCAPTLRANAPNWTNILRIILDYKANLITTDYKALPAHTLRWLAESGCGRPPNTM